MVLQTTLGSPAVIAAVMASATTIIGFGVQGWFLNSRIERIRHRHSEELAAQTSELQLTNETRLAQLAKTNAAALESLKHENSKQLEEFRTSLELKLQDRQNRKDALHRLLNASSIGHSGCTQLLKTARLHYPEDREELFRETAEGFQQLSVFFPAVTHAGLDDNLTFDDMQLLLRLQSNVFEFFFRLDLDKSGTEDYAKELAKYYEPVLTAYKEFERHVVQRKGLPAVA
jgi:hypothetical protein